MADEGPEERARWTEEFFRRAGELARNDRELERIRRRMAEIARAVEAGHRAPERAVQALAALKEDLEAHGVAHASDGEPSRQRLARQMLELVETLEERIRAREEPFSG